MGTKPLATTGDRSEEGHDPRVRLHRVQEDDDLPLSRADRRLQPEQGSRGCRRPAVDTKADELRGPWSDRRPTRSTMPPDVMPYATATSPPSPTSDMKVRFQVIRFHPADGVTVPHNFEAVAG